MATAVAALRRPEEGVHRAAQQWSIRLRAVSAAGDESLLQGGPDGSVQQDISGGNLK
jgi:hypothetical protein